MFDEMELLFDDRIEVKTRFTRPVNFFGMKIGFDNYYCDTLSDAIILACGGIVYDSLNDCKQAINDKFDDTEPDEQPFEIDGDRLLGFSFEDDTMTIYGESYVYSWNKSTNETHMERRLYND